MHINSTNNAPITVHSTNTVENIYLERKDFHLTRCVCISICAFFIFDIFLQRHTQAQSTLIGNNTQIYA